MERIYDFIIFGASGFTGQYVVDEVAKIAEEERGLTWAVAGRSMDKLQAVLRKSSKRTDKELEETPIIIADVSNYNSLLEMCQKGRVVLNCVGPYRFYGEEVVKACLEGGASYLDISGEPQFLEKMQLLYSAKAKEAGVHVVGSCGFDSVPADMGLLYTRDSFIGDLNSVEGFLNITAGSDGMAVNITTLESAVYGFAHAGELPSIRKSLFPNPLPRSPHKPPKRSMLFYHKELDKWCLPFPGSDRSVVHRTQRYNFDYKQQRPVQFVPYFCQPSRLKAFAVIVFAIFFAIMSKFSLTRALFLKFPSFFTAGVFKKSGPTENQIKGTKFTFTFFGSGYTQKIGDPEAQHGEEPDATIITEIIGPEPGYVTTPICLTQAAVTLLKDKDHLPKDGGVYTPGAAFGETNLIKRLEKHGISFRVLSQ